MLNQIYSTTDLALAATISLFFPLDSIDKSDSRRAVFNFILNDQLIELVERYWNKSLLIEPQALFSQLKSIKTRLYEPK